MIEGEPQITIAGGTDNPFNYNGVGYDGKPSVPVTLFASFSFEQGWRTSDVGSVGMDYRAAIHDTQGQWLTLGGMVSTQRSSVRN